MNLSSALSGIENASASFESAAASVVKAVTVGSAGEGGDSVELSGVMFGLLKSQLDFSASIATEIVENNLNKTTLSVLA